MSNTFFVCELPFKFYNLQSQTTKLTQLQSSRNCVWLRRQVADLKLQRSNLPMVSCGHFDPLNRLTYGAVSPVFWCTSYDFFHLQFGDEVAKTGDRSRCGADVPSRRLGIAYTIPKSHQRKKERKESICLSLLSFFVDNHLFYPIIACTVHTFGRMRNIIYNS